MPTATLCRVKDAVLTRTDTQLPDTLPGDYRDWLHAILTRRHLACPDAATVISELVTNVLLHAAGPLRVTVRVDIELRVLHLAVHDTTPPARRPDSRPEGESGLGLMLVAALCSSVKDHDPIPGRPHTIAVTLDLEGAAP